MRRGEVASLTSSAATAAQLAENDNARDVKMNEMVGREGLRKAPRCCVLAARAGLPFRRSASGSRRAGRTAARARPAALPDVRALLPRAGRPRRDGGGAPAAAGAGGGGAQRAAARACERFAALQHAGQVRVSRRWRSSTWGSGSRCCARPSVRGGGRLPRPAPPDAAPRLFYKFFNVHSFKADLAAASRLRRRRLVAAAAASPAGDAAAAAAASRPPPRGRDGGRHRRRPRRRAAADRAARAQTAEASASADARRPQSPPGAATAATPPKVQPPKAAAAEQQLELWGELLPSPPPPARPPPRRPPPPPRDRRRRIER